MIQIVRAELDLVEHQEGVMAMLDGYSSDPMGDAKPLSEYSREHLIEGLRQHPTTIIFLAKCEEEFCGIAICFTGFSTFAARPLLNVHDFYVRLQDRKKGVAKALMDAIEAIAIASGYCKITLEVQTNNERARAFYGQ